ncbi:TPM domain-containing protein [Winogradskyella ursingii]|uniref:TPM domain-containing protein n=1 Tax=Winogradskyella ursingii TaxID=2686079 RepID=UPI0015CDAFFC|nr:TPM domain-containing protein [Winogradskyella ursingii]
MLCFFLGCKSPKNKATTVSFQSFVIDSSDLFSKSQRDSLTLKILDYERQTTNEIAVLIIDSLLQDQSIQVYSTNVANKLGVGKLEKDNGLIITISKYDRQIAISTGLGTEKTISDYECKEIIESIVVPHFQKRKYYEGIDRAIDSLILLWD